MAGGHKTDPDPTKTCCWGYGWMCNGACTDPESHQQRSDCTNPAECNKCSEKNPDPSPNHTRELLFKVWGYLLAVDLDNRDDEWDTLSEQVKQKLNGWRPDDH